MINPATQLLSHPIADLFPLMDGDEYRGLVEDIRTNGLREPIWTFEGQVIDGRNRYRACRELGIEPETRSWSGAGSLVAFVVSMNLHRRQLTASQRAMIAVDIEPALAEEARERQRKAAEHTNAVRWAFDERARQEPKLPAATFEEQLSNSLPKIMAPLAVLGEELLVPELGQATLPPRSVKAAAKTVGVAHSYVSDAKKVTNAAPELAQQVRSGALTLPDAKREVQRREREQKAAEPKPIVARKLLPAIIEVADATALPLDDDVANLIVTSPPYGLDKAYRDSKDPAEGWVEFMRDWLAEAYRVTAPSGRLALNVPLDTTDPTKRPCYAQAVQVAIEAGWQYQWSIVWNEDNVTRSVARGSVDSASAPHVIARVEMIAVFSKGEWRREPRNQDAHPDHLLLHEEWLSWTNGLWTFPGESRRWEGHPAPFPEELPRRLIKLLSFPGDLVLDPFLGSGTTVLAAYKLGRQPIGYDISEAYVESAARRLQELVSA